MRDAGPGIPAEAQERIFCRFERVQAQRTQAGFGLGLYIVRELVEAHGGSIRLHSEPGHGACFTVELPGALPGVLAAASEPRAPALHAAG